VAAPVAREVADEQENSTDAYEDEAEEADDEVMA
jgi:hypothetical protein